MKKRQSQIDRLWQLLDMYEWIDPILCWQQIGSMKLATLISYIIKERGDVIEKQRVEYTNAWGEERFYMTYRKKKTTIDRRGNHCLVS